MTAAPVQPKRRDWLTDVGLLVAAMAAIVSSGASLAGLAQLAGWPTWLAVMLPATVDLYAITATRVWLSRRTTEPAVRRYAAANALTGISASVVGNALYHGLVAGALSVPRWTLVVVVSTVPPIVIGALAHLTALRRREAEPVINRRTSKRSTSNTDHAAPRTGTADSSPDRTGPATRSTTPQSAGGEHAAHRATTGPRTVDQEVLAEAAQAYRASAAAGTPLSERGLAERHGLSRRQARKAIAAVRDVPDADDPAIDASATRLALAAAGSESGEVA